MKGPMKGIRVGGGTSGNVSRLGRMIHKKPMKPMNQIGKDTGQRPQKFTDGMGVPNMMPLRK